MTTLPFRGTSPTPVDGKSLLQSLSHDYSEVAESFLIPFSIDSNPDTFCVEKPAITPTVDACGSNSKYHSSVMYNQSKDKISSSVELQEIADKITGVIDPAKLVKLISTPEKEYIIKNGPNPPDKSVLTSTRQPHSRHYSPQVFYYVDGTKRQWVSYSPSKDALFCVPCILFSDAVLIFEFSFHRNKEISDPFLRCPSRRE